MKNRGKWFYQVKRKTNPAFQKKENGSNLEENIVGGTGREGEGREEGARQIFIFPGPLPRWTSC